MKAPACCQVQERPQNWHSHSHRPRAREDPELQLSGQCVQDSGAHTFLEGGFASEPDARALLHDDSVAWHALPQGIHMVHIAARASRLVEGDVPQLPFQGFDGIEVVAHKLHSHLPHDVKDDPQN